MHTRLAMAVLFLAGPLACTAATDGGDSGPPAGTTRIELGSSGLSSSTATVKAGEQLAFQNTDTLPHQIASTPHPIHNECPELNGPVLQPGQSFTATLTGNRSQCGFHDHLTPEDSRFYGTITVIGGPSAQQ